MCRSVVRRRWLCDLDGTQPDRVRSLVDMATQPEVVRVAASSRKFLVSWKVGFGCFLAVVVYSVVLGGGDVPELPGPVILGLVLVLWWFNRANAVWVERDREGVRVRTRRWSRYEDWYSGKIRAPGTVLIEFSDEVLVSYAEKPAAWWRSDRELTVGTHRLSIYPEAERLASALADVDRWERARK